MLRLLPLIFRNVSRNRRRSLLTLASTAISLCLLALLMSLYQGFFLSEDRSPSEARRMIVRHKVSLTQALPASYRQRIQSFAGVDSVSPWQWFGGEYIEPKNFFAQFGVDPENIFRIHQDWSIPADQLAKFQRTRTGCAVGRALADRFHWKIGDRITLRGTFIITNLELTVVGIFEHPPQTESLLFNREYLRELLPSTDTSRDECGTFIVLAKSPDDVPSIARYVDGTFANSPYPTKTESEKEFGRSFLAFLGNLKLFLAIICAAVTFTILLVSANTIAMAVRERTREIAILRTLGFHPGEILLLILGEAALLSVLGGLVGLLMAHGLISATGATPMPLPRLTPETVSLTLALAALIGIVSAIIPAKVASQQNVIESLRFAG